MTLTAIRMGSSTRVLLFLILVTVAGVTKTSASDLIDAARNQDLATAQSLLSDGADPNATQPDGATALHWAVFRSNAVLVSSLIAAGAEVNAVNRLGASALYIAAKVGDGDMIELLLDAGATPDIALPMGETPVMSASRAGSLKGVQQLIAAGADVNAREKSRGQTALMWAAAQGHSDVARALITAGADLEARSHVRPMLMFVDATNGGAFDQGVTENLGGYSPLLFAARNGHLDTARVLLDAGADVNGEAGNGASPLVIAAHSGNSEVARLLLDNNADPDAIGAGYNALHAAILRGDQELVRSLLAHGANPNRRLLKATPVQRASEDWAYKTSEVSGTPYWLAAAFREAGIMRILFEGGADPRMTNLEEYRIGRERKDRENPQPPTVIGGFETAIHAAVKGDSTRQRFYVQANPDPVGEERRALASVKAALEHGVNPNETDYNGNTALHDAASRGLATVVQELAETGVDINATNARGQTPLDMAILSERRMGLNLLALETKEVPGPTAREVLEQKGALTGDQL